jgi:glycosyltransferase involved in cell wall biosynthesis
MGNSSKKNHKGRPGVMVKKYFIIVPSDSPHGPVKGAYALANSLTDFGQVVFVTVKKGSGACARLNSSIEKVCLADHACGYFAKLSLYRSMLDQAGGRANVISISMCLSADAINLGCKKVSMVCSSVRGNLIKNYHLDYGLPGLPIAIFHLLALRFFDLVFVMTNSMADQVKKFIGYNPQIVGNFIDEGMLDSFRRGRKSSIESRFVFVGSLTKRKRPLMLLESIKSLHSQGVKAYLDILGDGPLRYEIESKIKEYGLLEYVSLHGFKKNPYQLMTDADVMILPSSSEGSSRAVIEALYLGIPCVISDADGNSELVCEGYNGALFSLANEIPEAMLRALYISRKHGSIRPVLLKEENRQEFAALSFIKSLEKLFHD